MSSGVPPTSVETVARREYHAQRTFVAHSSAVCSASCAASSPTQLRVMLISAGAARPLVCSVQLSTAWIASSPFCLLGEGDLLCYWKAPFQPGNTSPGKPEALKSSAVTGASETA